MKSLLFSAKILCGLLVICSVALLSFNNKNSNVTGKDHTSMVTCIPLPKAMMDTPIVKRAVAMLTGTYADTSVSGSLKFETRSDGRVKMTLNITIPAKAGKSVAVHIHEHGDCGDMGKMAHGHWNPTNAKHGKWGSASFHSGDIGNIKLNAKGKGTLTITTDLWTLGGKADKNILGRSIIVHGGMDDYTTQPTGNAGGRIGCAVIQ